MRESKEARVSRMLQQGLECYGAGDFARAFLTWNEVLEVDPGNEEALDYLRDADRRSKPRGGLADGFERTLVDDARSVLRSENAEAALELLTSAGASGQLQCDAMIELLRASLYQRYQAGIGGMSKVPRVVNGNDGDLRGHNLPPSAGFLLSMIDGQTRVDDLVSLSGMDRFEAMRSLSRMFAAGILEWTK